MKVELAHVCRKSCATCHKKLQGYMNEAGAAEKLYREQNKTIIAFYILSPMNE